MIKMSWICGRLCLAKLTAVFVIFFLTVPGLSDEQTVKLGFNYSKTGPYLTHGLDQIRAAELVVDEINAKGGILGKKIELVWRDSRSRVDITIANITDLIDNEQVKMIFGGSASNVALAASRLCQEKKIVFFGTLTYSTALTGTQGHRHTFRECYNAWMEAKAIGKYLQKHFPANTKKYFYITSDYSWGHTTEASIRYFTGTGNQTVHKSITTPFPDVSEADLKKKIMFARMLKPDVLVIILGGKNLRTAIRHATLLGLKQKIQIVVPGISLGEAEDCGPKVMEGVISTLPWCWQVPYLYGYEGGKKFVESFVDRYQRYPSVSGACTYTILHQYKEAVERAKSFGSSDVIRALEGHRYVSLKDEQMWRDFDHQSVQTVFTVKCKPEREVIKDRFRLDYFEILDRMPGPEAVRTRDEWNAERVRAGKPTHLEPLTD